MKYTITNTQLYKLMMDRLNYLANNAFEGNFDTFIILYYADEDTEDNDVIMEHDSYDGRLYIKKDYLQTFCRMFPIDEEDAREFIKDWFEWKYGVDVKYTEI